MDAHDRLRLLPFAVAALCTALAVPAYAADGKAVYEARCIFCHGESGAGDGPAGVVLKPPPNDFTAPAYWETATDDLIKGVIRSGKPGTAMVPFGQVLSGEEIDAVTAYLRTLAPQP